MNQPQKDQKKRRFPFRKPKNNQSKPQPKGNYAFIDSQNLNLGTQHVGFKMNWKKFREFLQEKYDVEKAFMFIGYVPDNEELYNQMNDAGYTVVLKPTVDMLMTTEELADEKHVTKGNVDADLVMYMMKEIPNYKKAILVSGDGDFYTLIEYLKGKQKLLNIMVPNYKYSSLLKKFESDIVRLDTLKDELAYRTFRRTKKSGSNTKKK
jgi:uncharacterized LabA/DUF88 family protein